jgi:hypothetical protein
MTKLRAGKVGGTTRFRIAGSDFQGSTTPGVEAHPTSGKMMQTMRGNSMLSLTAKIVVFVGELGRLIKIKREPKLIAPV